MTTVVVKETYRLGDLDFARYFDHAIGVLRELFRPVLFAFLVIALPPMLVYFAIDLVMGFSQGLYADSIEGMTPEAFMAFWIRGMTATSAYTVLYQLIMIFLCSVVSYMVGMYYLGQSMRLGESMRFTLARFIPLVIAHILYMVAFTVGMIFCVIPGIYLGVIFYIFVPAILFENAGPLEALRRSSRLVLQGEFLRILFIWLALGLLGLPMAVFEFIALNAAMQHLMQSVVGVVLQLFAAALVTVVYFSLRCKHEALDLEILANHIDLEAAEEAPAL